MSDLLYEVLEEEIKRYNKFNMYCSLVSADLDAEGNIHLVLSKDSSFPSTSDICKLLREFFVNKDLILVFNYLIRKEELEKMEEEVHAKMEG